MEEDDFISFLPFPGSFPAEEARAPFCLPVPGEAAPAAPASCEVLGKGEALLLSPSAALGIAGCVQGWLLGQQRGAQHLHPHQIPSPLSSIPPGKAPRALRESFPPSFALGVEQPLKILLPDKKDQSWSFTFPLSALQDTPAQILVPSTAWLR